MSVDNSAEELKATARGCGRTALIGIVMALIACVGFVWFGWFPYLHGAVRDELRPVMATGVAELAATPANGTATRLTIPLDDLSGVVNAQAGAVRISGIAYSEDNGGLRIDFDGEQGQHASYRFELSVNEAGEIVVGEPEGSGGLEAKLLAPESIAGATADGLNAWLAAEGLRANDVTVTADAIVVTVSPKN